MCGYIVYGLLLSKTKIKPNKTTENNPKRSTKKNSNVNYRTYHESKDVFRSTSHHVETGRWRWGAAATDQNSCLLVEIHSVKNKCHKKPNICAANTLATCAQNYRLSKINEETSNLPRCLRKGPPEGRSNCARPSSLRRDRSRVSEPVQKKQHSSVLELRTGLTIPSRGVRLCIFILSLLENLI